MDLETLIKLAKIMARPYMITTRLLAILLVLSILGNIYLATRETLVTFEANDNNLTQDSTVEQHKG